MTAGLIRLEAADGRASWYCRDCAPAAMLARTEFPASASRWPEKRPEDRCATCHIPRPDAAKLDTWLATR